MAIISEKYIAGLIDSDGSVGFTQLKTGWKPTLVMSIAQKTDHAEVLNRLKAQLGGYVRVKEINGSSYSEWCLNGKAAVMLLNRTAKHLVIKRDYVLWCLDNEKEKLTSTTTEFNHIRKLMRKTPVTTLPNYPSRKWLAGYFDGDGCIIVTNVRQNGQAAFQITIAAHNNDIAGLKIIQKNFGGHIRQHGKGDVSCWTLYVSRYNQDAAVKFIEYFHKHSVIKKHQLDLSLSHLRTNMPDGNTLRNTLQVLKHYPHRLNEEAPKGDAIVGLNAKV